MDGGGSVGMPMRNPGIAALCVALGVCATSRQEVAARLGDQFIGQNVDAWLT
jgi:hypothetical protein